MAPSPNTNPLLIMKKELLEIEEKALNNLTDAYKTCLEKQCKYAFTNYEVYFKSLVHFIAMLKDHPEYLEGKHKTFTETNYIMKVWGPVVEYVFNDPKLVVQWRESVNAKSSVAKKLNSTSNACGTGSIDDMIDFRICYNDHSQLIDLLNGEMGEEQRSQTKYFQDHSKLARETKITGDLFYSSNALTPKLKETVKIRGLHLSSLKGEIMECRLVDNGLYVYNKLDILHLPSSELDLNRCRTLVKHLLELKRGCLELSRTYRIMKEREKGMENDMDKMKNCPRSPYNDSDSRLSILKKSNGYQDWVRGSWLPPPKYSKTVYDGNIPPSLLSPPPAP